MAGRSTGYQFCGRAEVVSGGSCPKIVRALIEPFNKICGDCNLLVCIFFAEGIHSFNFAVVLIEFPENRSLRLSCQPFHL